MIISFGITELLGNFQCSEADCIYYAFWMLRYDFVDHSVELLLRKVI